MADAVNDRRSAQEAAWDRRRAAREVHPIEGWILDGGSLVAALVLVFLVAFDVHGTGRVLLTVIFVSYVPGRAVLTNWAVARDRSDVALPVVLSFAIFTVPAVVILWLHLWAPIELFYVVAVASVGALGIAVLGRTRSAIDRQRGAPGRDRR
jgi:uncharacterized membrane protein